MKYIEYIATFVPSLEAACRRKKTLLVNFQRGSDVPPGRLMRKRHLSSAHQKWFYAAAKALARTEVTSVCDKAAVADDRPTADGTDLCRLSMGIKSSGRCPVRKRRRSAAVPSERDSGARPNGHA